MENDKRRAIFNSREKLAMIARPSETPLTARSLNTDLAFEKSLRHSENIGDLERIPFRVPNVVSMRFIGSEPRRNLNSPMLNQSADIEGCGHGAKSALHQFLSQMHSRFRHLIRTASKGKAVEANHQRLRRRSQ